MKISLQDPEIKEALRFEADPTQVNQGVPLAFIAPNQALMTDASELGWAAVLGPHRYAGLWS